MSNPSNTKTAAALAAKDAKEAERKAGLGWKLWDACDNGTLVAKKALTRMIKMGADIDFKTPKGWTGLMAAAFEGHVKVVQLLIENGANKEAKNEAGCTPLYCAAQKGRTAVVRLRGPV